MLEHPRHSLPRPVWERGDFSAPADAEPVIDFSFVFGVIRRRIKLILLFVALALGVTGAIFVTSTPFYTASSRLIIEERNVDVLQREAVLTNPSLDSPEADGQLQLLRSEQLVREMIDELGLLEDPAFVNRQMGIGQRIRAALIQPLNNIEMLRPLLSTNSEPVDIEEAIDIVQRRTDVARVGLSYVFSISVTWTTPEMAARIANGIAEVFIADRLERRIEETTVATDWLEERLTELRENARAADAEVAQFRLDKNIIQAGREGLLNEQQLSSLNDQMTTAARETAERQDSLQRFAGVTVENIDTAPLETTPETELLLQMRSQLVTLRDQRADAAQQFGETHQVTLAAEEQISRLTERIAAEITRLGGTYESAYDVARQRQESLQAELRDLMGQSGQVDTAQVRLETLQSEAQVYRDLYDSYLQRYMQTVQQQTLPTSDARIISAAAPPKFDDVSGSTMAAMAVAIGLSVGLAAALVGERMDRTVRTSWQLRLATGVPTLGILPLAPPRESDPGAPALFTAPGRNLPAEGQLQVINPDYRQVLNDPMSRFTETIRRIKIAVDSASLDSQCAIVGFLSSNESAARGMVAANYAELLSSSGRKVLLMDLDLRDPALSRTLTPRATAGLNDFVAPGAMVNLQSAIWVDATSRVHFLPARGLQDSDSSDSRFVNADRLVHMLSQLANNYECIVLDMPPLAVSSDALSIAQLVAGYVIVTEWGKTSADAVSRQVSESGIPQELILGALLSEVDMKQYSKYERAD